MVAQMVGVARRQVDPAVQKQGAKGCHPQGGGGLQGGEGEGIHPIQGLLPKDQRPRQQQGGEEGEQFPPPKARQAPLAAEEVEAQNHHQLDGDVLLPHPAPVDGQGPNRGVITVDRERRKATEVAAVSSKAMLLAT